MTIALSIGQLQTRSKILSIGLISIALTACGGGGGSSDSTTNTSTASSGSGNSSTGSGSSNSGGGSSSGSGTSGTGTSSASHFLYLGVNTNLANTSSNTTIVNNFAIGTNGALSASSSVTLPAGVNANAMTLDPTGKYAYVVTANQNASVTGSGVVYQYSVGTNGALTPMTVPTFTPSLFLNNGSAKVIADPSGKYIYIAGLSNGNALAIGTYAIGSDGSLSAVTSATVPNSDSSVDNIAINSATNTLYLVSSNGSADTSITPFAISNGTLTAIAASTSIPSTIGESFVIDASNHYAYLDVLTTGTGGGSAIVYEYTIAGNGTLSPMSTPTVSLGSLGAYYTQLALDSSGKYAYATNNKSDTISQFTIGSSGVLTPLSTATVPATNPNFIVANPAGGSMFVGNAATNTIETYTIGSDGSLTTGGSVNVTPASGIIPFVTTY